MKKIAIFQRDLGMGGIQKSLVNLLNSIDCTKYEIDLYLFSTDNFFTSKLPKEINIIYLSPLPYLSRFIYFSLLKRIKKYNIKKEYDIAIDYNSYDPSCALACINTKAQEHIMWVHNDVVKEHDNDTKYRILHHFFQSKYKYISKYVCVSEGLIEPFKRLNKIENKSFKVIPNIIITEEIITKAKEKVTDLKVDPKKYNLISVGRFVIQKGFDILINDMKEIVKERQDIHLYIVGDGSLKKSLIKQVQDNHLEEYITFLGAKKNPFQYEALMDGFILESRYEGQGIVILEAKVLGLDLVIPEHLSKYIEDVPFTDNVKETVLSLKKNKNKKIDLLEDYNNKILQSIYQLLDE